MNSLCNEQGPHACDRRPYKHTRHLAKTILPKGRPTSPRFQSNSSPPGGSPCRRPLGRTEESVHAQAEPDAMIGGDASRSFDADTFCPASIHLGAVSRSSSGRFIVNAAT